MSLAMRRMRHICRPGTLAFVISDFADMDDAVEAEMRRLSVHAHLTNILVYDQMDVHIPCRGDYRVSDGERVTFLDELGSKQRQEYASAFAQRRDRIESTSRKHGMAFHALSTADDPRSVLHPHRGRPPRRRPGRVMA